MLRTKGNVCCPLTEDNAAVTNLDVSQDARKSDDITLKATGRQFRGCEENPAPDMEGKPVTDDGIDWVSSYNTFNGGVTCGLTWTRRGKIVGATNFSWTATFGRL